MSGKKKSKKPVVKPQYHAEVQARRDHLVHRVLRTLLTIQFVSVLMYVAYRIHVPSTRNTVTDRVVFALCAIFQALAFLSIFLYITVPRYSHEVVYAAMLLVTLNLGIDFYTLAHVVDTKFAILTLVINIVFALMDATILFVLLHLYVTAGPRPHTAPLELPPDTTGGRNNVAREIISTLVGVEGTLLFYYILIGISIGTPVPHFSGWIFVLHILTSTAAVAWLVDPGAPARVTSAYRWLLSAALLVFVLDVTQLGMVGSADVGTLIAIRALLFTVAVGYIGTIILCDAQLDLPPHTDMIFYAVQHGIMGIMLLEAFLVSLYFCYAVTTKTDPFLWTNLFHLATGAAALMTLSWPSRVTLGAGVLGGAALFTLVYEIFVIGILLGKTHISVSAVMIQFVLLAISVVYIALSVAIFSGTSDQDVVDYAVFVKRDAHYVSAALKFMWPKDARGANAQVGGRELSDLEASRFSAEKIYYLVMYFVRPVCVLEFALLFVLLMILLQNPPVWYEWFYMAHWLSIVAAVMVMTFSFDMEMVFIFLLASAFISLIVDATLIGVLDGKTKAPVIAIQSLFLIVDLLYISFFGAVNYKIHPAAFHALADFQPLRYRIRLSKAIPYNKTDD
jgi:hypothetical protein